MFLVFNDVNYAFRAMVDTFHSKTIDTVDEPSRNGPVRRAVNPVCITYTNPYKRVLFNTARDCNPFFHLYEAMWMLAGSNKTQQLAFYASNMLNYSDDGVVSNGAYGYRWRNSTQSIDQLDVLVNHLRNNPDSRRAVLNMWNVQDDLLKIDDQFKQFSVDVCCLHHGTKFRSPEGSTTIKELASNFQRDPNYKFPVYSVDPVTGDQRLSWMTNAWKVGFKPVYKITFDDGSTLKATGDHVVYRKKKMFEGKRCVGFNVYEEQVCNLTVGDRLLSALGENAVCRKHPRKVTPKNKTQYRQFKRNLYKNTGGSNMVREHREYINLVEGLRKGYSVHHIDGNGLNNSLGNLEQLANKEHYAIGMRGKENIHCKMSDREKSKRAEKLKQTWKKMPAEVRKAKGTKKKNRTARQWEILAEYESSKSNHRITAIEQVGVEEVYDFTVPGRHNAVVDNGVVVHNCNLSVVFMRRGDVLDMTVFNRSNDLVWGALGANVVHFSFLQEYVANCLGLRSGKYHQVSSNMHVYLDNWKPDEWLACPKDYVYGELCRPTRHPIFTISKESFDREVRNLVDANHSITIDVNRYHEPFLSQVVHPMCQAFKWHKRRDYSQAFIYMNRVDADDWRMAGTNWLLKRQENYSKRQATKEQETP